MASRHPSPWWKMGAEQMGEYLLWLQSVAPERWEKGREKYESDRLGFQGDPVEHAIEEWLDMGVYLFYTQRMVRELKAERAEEG